MQQPPSGTHPLRYRIPHRSGRYERLVKPALDRTASILLLVGLSPLLLVLALAVRLDSPGPVLFTQERVGQHGRRIGVLRFRAVDVNSQLWDRTLAGAPVADDLDQEGLTPFGRLLLRSKLDRLPELINVARGEMSLVGPRPPQPYEVLAYQPTDWVRLRVKPGITGLWQIRWRPAGSRAIDSDLAYLLRISPAIDVAILVATVAPARLRRLLHSPLPRLSGMGG